MAKRQNQLRNVVLCITEDWFATSHFQPLIKILCDASGNVTIVTHCSQHRGVLEELGANVIDFDFQRSEIGPFGNLVCAVKLSRILKTENPTAIHCVAMKPIILGALATLMHGVPARIFHTTGLGYLATSNTLRAKFARRISFFVLNKKLQRLSDWLLAENPDDLAFLERHGVHSKNQPIVIGGAGVDPPPILHAQSNRKGGDQVSVAIASRMIRSKGIEDLIDAHQLLATKGIHFNLELYGDIDEGNPDSHTKGDLSHWTQLKNIRWHGHVKDLEDIWGRSDIAVVASRDREGLPRSMLEAAAFGCPLIVTDIPGCRHFVRNGVEGFVVPPNRPDRLAQGIQKLIQNQSLRQTFGAAARQRVLDHHSTAHVKDTLSDLYTKVASQVG